MLFFNNEHMVRFLNAKVNDNNFYSIKNRYLITLIAVPYPPKVVDNLLFIMLLLDTYELRQLLY